MSDIPLRQTNLDKSRAGSCVLPQTSSSKVSLARLTFLALLASPGFNNSFESKQQNGWHTIYK